MKNENRNEEAVSPVIATILMVAITVVLAGVLYVWASSLAEGNTDGDLTLYDISAVDAGGDVTTGTDDDLVRITMNQGSDINWAAVKISISVDGDAPITCDNPGQTGGQSLQLSSETHQTTTGQSVTVSQSQSLDKTFAHLEHVPLR